MTVLLRSGFRSMWLTVALLLGYGLILDTTCSFVGVSRRRRWWWSPTQPRITPPLANGAGAATLLPPGGAGVVRGAANNRRGAPYRMISSFGNRAKWVTRRVVPVSAACGVVSYVCYRQWEGVKENQDDARAKRIVKDPVPFGPWALKFYVSLVPRKIQSRIFGYINNITLPVFLRRPLLGLFCYFYNCDLSEALEPDLRRYSNLSEFFRRSLKPDVRPVAEIELVSPADGRVDRFGEIVDNKIEQVKGITYDVSSFVGEDLALKYIPSGEKTKRFYCVIYLAPGDYHGFHSPADWVVNFRRHFTGHLLSVHERVTKRVANLFCINERVLLGGRWTHGFFTMTAVGATNVGNISLNTENSLVTNRPGRQFSHVDDLVYAKGVEERRGEKVGEFRLGSSIVLYFEAPHDFEFKVNVGQKVKYGQALGQSRKNNNSNNTNNRRSSSSGTTITNENNNNSNYNVTKMMTSSSNKTAQDINNIIDSNP